MRNRTKSEKNRSSEKEARDELVSDLRKKFPDGLDKEAGDEALRKILNHRPPKEK